ncbi:unnamed protein product, partial [marine sediment metagenome]
IAAKRSHKDHVFFVLTSFGGIRVDADVSAVELGDGALEPSDFSVMRVSTGLVELTLNKEAIRGRGRGSRPLLVAMEATIDDTILTGLDIAGI